MDRDAVAASWFMAIFWYLVFMVFFSAFHLIPTYSPVCEPSECNGDPLLIELVGGVMHVVLGPLLILFHLGSENLAFGVTWWGTRASHALVIYALMIPYIGILMFFIPGEHYVPLGYRLFQRFIVRSGARSLTAVVGRNNDAVNIRAMDVAASAEKASQRIHSPLGGLFRDKYEEVLEKEELAAAGQILEAEAKREGRIADAYERLLVAQTNEQVARLQFESTADITDQAEIQARLYGLISERKKAEESLIHARNASIPNKPSKQVKGMFSPTDRRNEAARIKAKTEETKKLLAVIEAKARRKAWESGR